MENWQSAETQKDIEQLMSAYGDFHDACIVSLNFQSGAFVDDKSAMHFGGCKYSCRMRKPEREG